MSPNVRATMRHTPCFVDALLAPVSSFHGAPVVSSAGTCPRQAPSVPGMSYAQPEDRGRAAEIDRVMSQLRDLRAQKAAHEEMQGELLHRPPPNDYPPKKSNSGIRRVAPSAVTGSSRPLQRLGRHGEESRFCPLSTVEASEGFPRIVAVAGHIADLDSATVVRSPRFGGDGFEGEPETGKIAWTYIPPGYGGEIVAVPQYGPIRTAHDPIALRVPLNMFGNLQDVQQDRDGLAVVDRSEIHEFENYRFYLWDIEGMAHLGWFRERPTPSEATCLGKLLCVLLEEDDSMAKAKSCWGEANELY